MIGGVVSARRSNSSRRRMPCALISWSLDSLLLVTIIQLPTATQLHTFAKVGRCIYCGAGPEEADLSLEHIIPEAIGGRLKLPDASCSICAAKTCAFEGHVIGRMFGDNRAHLGTRRKGRKKFGDDLKIICDGQEISIPRDQHPGILPNIILNKPPGILMDPSPTNRRDWGTCDMHLVPVVPDFKKRLAAQSGKRVLLNKSFGMDQFAQTLAKIAHSYVVAQIGLDAFTPFLTRSIRSKHPTTLPHYIGGHVLNWQQYRNPPLHQLRMASLTLENDNRPLLIVSVRLYAPLRFAAYDVVVGRAIHPEPPHQLDASGKPLPLPESESSSVLVQLNLSKWGPLRR